jgi:hypothetical protein
VFREPESLPSFHVKTVKFLGFSMSCASDRGPKSLGIIDVKKLVFGEGAAKPTKSMFWRPN